MKLRLIVCFLLASTFVLGQAETPAPTITEIEQSKVDALVSELGRLDAEIRVRQREIELFNNASKEKSAQVPYALGAILTAHNLDPKEWDFERDGTGMVIFRPLKLIKRPKPTTTPEPVPTPAPATPDVKD